MIYETINITYCSKQFNQRYQDRRWEAKALGPLSDSKVTATGHAFAVSGYAGNDMYEVWRVNCVHGVQLKLLKDICL